MKYRELINLYKSGEIDEENKKRVERDIERQEAISEYLFDSEEIPGIDDVVEEESVITAIDDNEDVKFTKLINRSIRRAFIKMGVCVAVITLAIVLFVVYLLPGIVDEFYYEPDKIAGTKDGMETNYLSLDMAVYTELFKPGYYRDNVIVESNGYGEYDINILQTTSYTGTFTNVAGTIKKNKLVLYDSRLLNTIAINSFLPYKAGVNYGYRGMESETMENAIASIEGLDDNERYIAYVTLSEVMSYNEFEKWSEEDEIFANWCATCFKNENGFYADGIIGFTYNESSHQIYYDTEKYPYLSQFDVSLTAVDNDFVASEEVMTTHYTSMLRYMADRDEFRELMGDSYSSQEYEDMAKNVEQNGINIYGFTTVLEKAELLELCKNENIHYIYVQDLK